MGEKLGDGGGVKGEGSLRVPHPRQVPAAAPPAGSSASVLCGEKCDFPKRPLCAPVEFGVKLRGALGSVRGRLVSLPKFTCGSPNPQSFSL